MAQPTVASLMKSCPDVIVSETIGLREAAESLVLNDIAVLIAVNGTGQLSGVVPESAVIRQLMLSSDRGLELRQVISRHCESVSVDANLDSALPLFRSSCNVVVPVVDDQRRVVGILQRIDVVRYLLQKSGNSSSSNDQRPHFLKRPDLTPKDQSDTAD